MYLYFRDLSIKLSDWSYEKEWQISRNKPGYYHNKPEQVKEVYFGYRCSLDVKGIVIKLPRYLPKDHP